MIPADFTFSQYSIQDFLDCQRRFILRHVLHLPWPAPVTDDQAKYEHHRDQGQTFHRCLQQYFSGVPAEVIGASISDELLAGWWDNFLSGARSFPWSKSGELPFGLILKPEFQLTAILGSHRVTAKYDLITGLPGNHFWIYDWKTSPNPASVEKLELHPQTRLYCWLLADAGASVNLGLVIPPEQISMTYWYVQQPARPVSFQYSAEQFETDGRQLTALLDYICSIPEDEFRLADDLRQCRYCVYRSYCERGFKSGEFKNMDADAGLETLPDWDDIDPVELG